jgi:hypothetical protein
MSVVLGLLGLRLDSCRSTGAILLVADELHNAVGRQAKTVLW